MSFVWNMENIRKLAPDGLSMNRAMGIFFASKWEDIGGNEKMIWAKYPYYPGRYFNLIIQLDPLKYQCSCSSKLEPCKHVLGLLVQLYRNSEAFFITSQIPDWGTTLLTPTKTTTQQKKIAPISSKALLERRKIMKSGIEILDKWLHQLVRHGFAEVQHKPLSYWDDIAAQLVDAKLGEIAKRIRAVKEFIGDETWAQQLSALVGELYLYVKTYKKHEELPPAFAKDIDSYAGITPKRGAVLETKGIEDHWYVLGQVFGVEEQLSYRRTWLWGVKSGVPALNLAYSWGGQPYLHDFAKAKVYNASLHFYPSAYPLRAITEEVHLLKNATHHPQNGYTAIKHFLTHFAEAKALNPFLQNFPVLLHQVVLWMDNKTLTLVDSNKQTLVIHCEEEKAWQLLAFGAGGEVTFFGEWQDGSMTPHAVWKEERYLFI